MYGWRARIGLLVVASDVTCSSELSKFSPEGVSFLTSRMDFPGKVTVETIEKLAEGAEKATEQLIPAKVDVVAFCCTSGSFIKGSGWDTKIIETLEEKCKGISVTTTSTAVSNALQKLGVHNLAVATPYINDINLRLEQFLTNESYNVVNINGLEIVEDSEVNDLPEHSSYNMAKDVDVPEADCIFISCTSVPTFEAIAKIENDLGKPVITSNQATMWDCLNKVNIKYKTKSLGKLFQI
jgi:maleate isomerase